jgi:hypothetical protein
MGSEPAAAPAGAEGGDEAMRGDGGRGAATSAPPSESDAGGASGGDVAPLAPGGLDDEAPHGAAGHVCPDCGSLGGTRGEESAEARAPEPLRAEAFAFTLHEDAAAADVAALKAMLAASGAAEGAAGAAAAAAEGEGSSSLTGTKRGRA